MRSLVVQILTIGLLATVTTVQAETYPYVAYVAPANAQVYSGPGKAYYATDDLSAGMKLEVFREVAGWLAIRPPLGSFCWVPARDVELTDTPDVAQVLSEETVAWIGTRIDKTADHVWQVKLTQGDRVKVLGVKRRAGQNGQAAETWYRIAPPEGEYRWIRAEDITRDGTPTALAHKSDSSDEATSHETTDQTSEVADEEGTRSVLVNKRKTRSKPFEVTTADAAIGDDAIGTGVEKAQFIARPERSTKRPATKSTSGDATRETIARESATSSKPSPFKVVDGSTSTAAPAATPTPRVASLDKSLPRDPQLLLSSSGSFDDRLTEIELQLALMVAKDPAQWQLEPLRLQAEQLVLRGQTTLERGRARLVVDKIGQFDALAHRKFEAPQATRNTSIEEVQEPTLPEKPADDAPTGEVHGLKVPEGVTYDGVGWLKPVYSEKRVVPPYALVDVNGKVLQFVTPAPGLNLNRYVKKPVGIFGQKRDFVPEYKAGHITASRIVELTKYQDK